MPEGGREAVRVDDAVIGATGPPARRAVRNLERLLGRKTLSNDCAEVRPAAAGSCAADRAGPAEPTEAPAEEVYRGRLTSLGPDP
jgi:hypothetical protein